MIYFLFPSLYEGLPFSCIESQANGIPSIISNTISDELFITNNTIFLPIKNPFVWSKQILSNKLERINSYDSFKGKNYLIEETTKILQEMYLSLIKNK